MEGFLEQTADFPFEIIVHDDASTDGTVDILQSYAEDHPQVVKLVLQSDNQYAQGNGFVGLKLLFTQAQGKYIAYCEGDDYWADTCKLQKQIEFLEEHPEYVLTYHNAKTIDELGRSFHYEGAKSDDVVRPSSRADFSPEELKVGDQHIATLTICFRNIFKMIDYPEELCRSANGDTFLFSLLGNYGAGKYMGDQIQPAMNRIHNGGVWSLKPRREQLRMLALTYNQLTTFYTRSSDRESAYHFREKSFMVLKALLVESVRSGTRRELVGAYRAYCLIGCRHLAASIKLNAKVWLRLLTSLRA